jgi:hypothetical protein
MDKIYFEWSKMNLPRVTGSGYTWFRGIPGLESYPGGGSDVTNKWQLDNIRQ